MKRLSLFLALVALFSMPVVAQSAGYDLFQTGAGTSVDLSSLGLGVVKLQGVPIQSSTGNTDTIMHRTAAVPSGGGSVPVNVNALFLQSTSSVTYNGQSADVYVTINNSGGQIATSVLPQPDSLSASTGTVTVRTDGTFDSNITVNADLIFVKAGTSVTNSSNWIGHQGANAISLSSSNSPWQSTAPPNYPVSNCYPSGGFYPFPKHTGPHPVVPGKKTASAPSAASPLQAATAAPGANSAAIAICVATAQ